MSEFMPVTHPAIYPQACIVCQSAKGPLVDTVGENAIGRVYVCALCVKRCAKALGLVKGERMEELLQAGELLDAARKDIADRDQTIQKHLTELAARKRKLDALEELRRQQDDERATQQHVLEQIVEQSQQLIGAVTGG